MTYFGFLGVFLGVPLAVLSAIYVWDRRKGRKLPPGLWGFSFWFTALAHVAAALLYTTPWDNYLVASGVWYYDPARVTGVTLGYVPIEEYMFFVVQTLTAALWLHCLALRLPMPAQPLGEGAGSRLGNRLLLAALAAAWLLAVLALALGYEPGTYLALIVGWAAPPIMLQLIFGGDILHSHRRLVVGVILPLTLYISLADSFAIAQGIWVIAPQQSLNVYLGGVLPIEEFVFFLATNTLIGLGSVLFLARQSHERMLKRFPQWRRRAPGLSSDLRRELDHGSFYV